MCHWISFEEETAARSSINSTEHNLLTTSQIKTIYYMGRFPFDVKFQFELPENSMNVGKGQLFPEFPEKMTLRSIPNSFWENSHREFQFHLIFPRRIFRFSVEWFVFNNFRIFWKLFAEISETFGFFSIFGIFGWMESTHHKPNCFKCFLAFIDTRVIQRQWNGIKRTS